MRLPIKIELYLTLRSSSFNNGALQGGYSSVYQSIKLVYAPTTAQGKASQKANCLSAISVCYHNSLWCYLTVKASLMRLTTLLPTICRWMRTSIAFSVLLFLTGFTISATQAEVTPLTCRVDQWGYHTNAPKSLLVEGLSPNQKVSAKLLDPSKWDRLQMNKGRPVFNFKRKKHLRWVPLVTDLGHNGPATSGIVLDFSEFKVPGDYQLMVNNQRALCDIRISEYVYWDALRLVMRTWLHQRSGTEIIDRETKLAHSISHTRDALLPSSDGRSSKFLNVIGGWYDTGNDFTKSVAENSLSAAKVLSFYNQSPKAYRYMTLNFPVAERLTHPDILQQMKYGLDWVLSMQASDGHFYDSVSGDPDKEPLAPEDDHQPRFVRDGNLTERQQTTAIAAATLAIASRAYKHNDLSYSVKTALAAQKAWRWLESSSQSESLAHPQRLWAATELAITTGKPAYTGYIQRNIHSVPLRLFSARNPMLLGAYHYALYPKAATNLKRVFTGHLLSAATALEKRIQAHPYNFTVQPLVRNSNEIFTEHLGVLLMAYNISGNTNFRSAASVGLHYLFGQNPLGQGYVTGLVDNETDKSPKTPHHKGIKAWGDMIPGHLVSGPNPLANDGVTPKGQGLASYADDFKAIDSNATSIRQNASLAFVLGELNTSLNLVGSTTPDALRQLLDGPKPWQAAP